MGNPDTAPQELPKPDKLLFQAVRLPRGQVPAGAYRIPADDLEYLQFKKIKEWRTESDKWWLKRGMSIAGSCTALTGIIINFYFRRRFNLQGFNVGLSYVPGVVLPTLFSLISSENFKKKVILAPDFRESLEVRSGILQVCTSVIYSTVICTVTSLFISRKHYTFLMGKKTFEPNLFHALKTSNVTKGVFVLLLLVNFGTASLITHLQGQEIENIMSKDALAHHQKEEN